MKKELYVKAVIFDMDGVITNTMPYHADAWLATLSSAGIYIDRNEIYRHEGQDGLSTLKEWYKTHHKHVDVREIRELLRTKEELFKKIVKVKYVKGARTFIRRLRKQKFLLALVTGTSRDETERMLPGKLLSLFDVTITGDEVTKAKPHPEPYLKAMKLLGLKRGEAVVIENAPFGIQAAKSARLFCVALETSLSRKYLRRADIIVGSFDELKKILRLKKERRSKRR